MRCCFSYTVCTMYIDLCWPIPLCTDSINREGPCLPVLRIFNGEKCRIRTRDHCFSSLEHYCCIHKQKESSGGIYSLFHTKYLEGNKDNCTRAITLRSLAMSVTTSLCLSSLHYD